MDLFILFGQRKEAYDGEHAPEALLCWTEFDVDENNEGWNKAVDEAKKEYAASMTATRVIRVSVDQARVRRLLLLSPLIQGDI
jgi:hypothetical protein